MFDSEGVKIYSPSSMTITDVPFLVRIKIPDLNIRTGAGTNYPRTGSYTGIGTFTIVKVQTGVGSSAGWGKLKSGAGWVALDFCERI